MLVGVSLSLLAMSANDQIRGFVDDAPGKLGGEPVDRGGMNAGWLRSYKHSGLSGPLSGLDSLHSLPVSGASRG